VLSQPVKSPEHQPPIRIHRRVLSLPAYDVRMRKELAQRRLFVAIGRQVMRVVSLHALDAIVVIGAAIAAAMITTLTQDQRILVPLAGLVLLGLNARSAYNADDARRDPVRIITGVIVATAALLLTSLLPASFRLPADFLLYFAFISAVGLLAERWLVELAVRQAYARGIGIRKAVIVGRHAEVREVIAALHEDGHGDHCIAGYVTPTHVIDPQALGSVDDIDAILDQTDPAELILTASLGPDVLQRVANACVTRGVAIFAVPSWSHAIRGWVEPVRVGKLPAYHVHPARLAMPALMLKRATDLALTTTGLVAAAPLMGLIALAIKLDSRGPVFYRQQRVGLGGRLFTMWKFRSMVQEADETRDSIAHLNSYGDDRLFKLPRDPRITRVGRLLRRFSLDELPQLINVLLGDMSLVGPRPPLPSEVGKYEPRHFVRLSVVPGMTGPWQVNGRNLITDFEEIVSLEKGYVEAWSLSVDLQIMVRTVGVVLSGKGAY
jgi:exopolysaccharide biosynthesis polyprenyl glycosylphosphotransferase